MHVLRPLRSLPPVSYTHLDVYKRQLVERALRDVSSKARKKSITIKQEPFGRIQAVYDLKWTQEALFNILDNGVKYSPPGSAITVSVKVYEMHVCIQVEDEGPGIPEEERTKIFQRFYRGEDNQQEEGVGIGLYPVSYTHLPAYTVSYMGVNGGLVIVVADDPGLYSSQNEQDTRMVARAAQLPVLEPSDSAEAKDYIKVAYELSLIHISRLNLQASHQGLKRIMCNIAVSLPIFLYE